MYGTFGGQKMDKKKFDLRNYFGEWTTREVIFFITLLLILLYMLIIIMPMAHKRDDVLKDCNQAWEDLLNKSYCVRQCLDVAYYNYIPLGDNGLNYTTIYNMNNGSLIAQT